MLPGQGWSITKRPTFSTRVASHVSGREARVPFYAYPLYEFEMTFDALDSAGKFPGLGANSLQALLGLYLQCQGQYGTFLYVDPSDHLADRQIIATGDRISTTFVLVRTYGGFTEPVGWVLSNPPATIYDNDTVVANTDYSIYAPHGSNNMIAFSIAPQEGHIVSASFAFAYLCRFADDQSDFQQIMDGLWQATSVKFRSVRP